LQIAVFGLILFIIVFITSFSGVEIFRRWSMRRNIFDVPNERSSHETPTPRGGGVVIVLSVLITYVVLSLLHLVEFEVRFFIGSILIAFISWLDDLFTISFIWRFFVHSISAILIILNQGYFQVIEIPWAGTFDIGLIGAVLTFLWIVWMTNAYNFMDGIDGIAGLQATIGGIGWFFAGKLLGMQDTSVFFLIIAAASLGFLIHNWQPAKIFMGDVGSAFLGFCFAAVPLFGTAANSGVKAILPYIAVSFVWLFLFDTVYTFIKRLISGQKVWQAHREHFYQQLIILRHSHEFVTILYGSFALLNSLIIYLLVSFSNKIILYILALISFQSLFILIYVINTKRTITFRG